MNASLEAGAEPARTMTGEKVDEGGRQRTFKAIVAVTICLSAFLLFQVQLILGKFLLPWFGGTSAVWATCLVFFQVLLLGGYIYSHKLCSTLKVSRQATVHLLVLGITSLVLAVMWSSWGSPFLPNGIWKPLPGVSPIPGLLKLLLIAIGLPFLLLSTTGPLLQKWYNETSSGGAIESPYFLYALSNAGSLLGLISYPAIVEPRLGLDLQSKIWGIGFIIFALGCAVCALIVRRFSGTAATRIVNPSERIDSAPVPRAVRWLWFILPAIGSAMLLATTNLVTQDVAPVPLLWVLPLSIYLLTYVITFKSRSWYYRGLFHCLFAANAALVLIALFRGSDMDQLKQTVIFLAMLFIACMLCHGELARIKPAPAKLTAYYLNIASGGAVGGILVGLVAPIVFPAIWEYNIAIWAVAIAASIALVSDRQSWLRDRLADPLIPTLLFAVIFVLPKCLARVGLITIPHDLAAIYTVGVYLVIALVIWLTLRRRSGSQYWLVLNRVSLAIALVVLTVALSAHLRKHKGRLVFRERNFYGPISVHQEWDLDMLHSKFVLMHGRIVHGMQLQENRKVPTTYYGLKSGIGRALTSSSQRNSDGMRVGVVGLGAGTLACYGRTGDVYRFYEINPKVIRVAEGGGGYFTFLKDSLAKIEMVQGDARLSLEAEAAGNDFQNFDVLVLDAFNGDSIPIHLLTKEAMSVYLKHLRGPDSIIALHVSNLTLDLSKPVSALATFYSLKSALIITAEDNGVVSSSEWILLTRGDSLNLPEIRSVAKPVLAFATNAPELWTDDYSNIIDLLDYRRLSFRSWLHF